MNREIGVFQVLNRSMWGRKALPETRGPLGTLARPVPPGIGGPQDLPVLPARSSVAQLRMVSLGFQAHGGPRGTPGTPGPRGRGTPASPVGMERRGPQELKGPAPGKPVGVAAGLPVNPGFPDETALPELAGAQAAPGTVIAAPLPGPGPSLAALGPLALPAARGCSGAWAPTGAEETRGPPAPRASTACPVRQDPQGPRGRRASVGIQTGSPLQLKARRATLVCQGRADNLVSLGLRGQEDEMGTPGSRAPRETPAAASGGTSAPLGTPGAWPPRGSLVPRGWGWSDCRGFRYLATLGFQVCPASPAHGDPKVTLCRVL